MFPIVLPSAAFLVQKDAVEKRVLQEMRPRPPYLIPRNQAVLVFLAAHHFPSGGALFTGIGPPPPEGRTTRAMLSNALESHILNAVHMVAFLAGAPHGPEHITPLGFGDWALVAGLPSVFGSREARASPGKYPLSLQGHFCRHSNPRTGLFFCLPRRLGKVQKRIPRP